VNPDFRVSVFEDTELDQDNHKTDSEFQLGAVR
jgi:hypothetical protein